MTRPDEVWTEAEHVKACAMYAERSSFTAIANELGTRTRNAVGGHLARAGVLRKEHQTKATMAEIRKKDNAQRRNKRCAAVNKRDERALAIWVDPSPSAPVDIKEWAPASFAELKEDGCRFPFGHRNYTFCNVSPCVPNTPYCQVHARLCYPSPRDRQ